jgi:radical SAM protein with 4Fe4S-binding SPASM domain
MQEISLVRLKEIIDEASKLKVNGIVFGGGEPFCRKDILEILEYTIKKGISCCVSTKKYLDKETCERLKEIGLEKIQVSIDSIKKEKANFMAGSNFFYDEILETIKNLQRVGIKVRIKAVVTSYNISDIPSLILSLKNDGILDFHIVCYGRSIYRYHDSIFASQDEIQKLKNSIDQIKRENPELNLAFGGMEEEKKMASEKEKWESFEKRAICSAGRSSLNILPDGRVTLCEQLPSRDEFCIGDLRKQSLLDIWNSDLLISFLRPERKRFIMTSCYDCEIFDDCNWVKGRCFRRAYQVFGSIFAPDPKCPKSGVNVRFS